MTQPVVRELLQAKVERDSTGFYIVTFADGRQTYTKKRSAVADMAADLHPGGPDYGVGVLPIIDGLDEAFGCFAAAATAEDAAFRCRCLCGRM